MRPDLFAFLLIGSKTDFELLITYVPFIVVAFLAIVVVRILSVYPIIGINKLMGEKISHSWTRVIALAGLRGVVLCVGLLVGAHTHKTTPLMFLIPPVTGGRIRPDNPSLQHTESDRLGEDDQHR